MTALLLLIATLAWGQDPPDDVALARQQAHVTELARVAAEARDSAAPRGEVAAAMKAYRAEAEALARMRASAERATLDAEQAGRAMAISGLEEALASGRADTSSRAVLAAWLGDLDAQLDVLRKALDDVGARPEDPLSSDLALDVAEKAQVIWLAASYDGSRARSDARDLRLRSHTLRSRSSSGMSGGLDDVLEAKALDEEAVRLEAKAAGDHQRAERAAALQREALALAGERP